MDGYVTVSEAAATLGLSRQGIQRRIARGDLRAERLGPKFWVIPRDEVERWRRLGRQKPGWKAGRKRATHKEHNDGGSRPGE